jgi:hypothetical protein
MWNFLSYPKWVYGVPWVGYLHVFEMPLLGYDGYLPHALNLYALYHLVVGALGHKATDYVRVAPDNNRPVPWPWKPERSTPTPARSSVGGFCLDSQGRAGRSRIGADTRLASPYHSGVIAR